VKSQNLPACHRPCFPIKFLLRMKINLSQSTGKSKPSTRSHSRLVLDGPERAPSRAMLYAVGFKKEDFAKPLIGIASTWSMVTPCNAHIDQLAREAERAPTAPAAKPSSSAPSPFPTAFHGLRRNEILARLPRSHRRLHRNRRRLRRPGWLRRHRRLRQNMPGAVIAMARLNRPAVFVYGGTILPGCITGESRKLDIVSVFEAVGAHANKRIDDAQLEQIESCAIPGPGSCGGMYTANTMASAIEALGMSLPNSSAQNAISNAKKEDCRRAGAAVLAMLQQGIRPATSSPAAPSKTPSPSSSPWAARPTRCFTSWPSPAPPA